MDDSKKDSTIKKKSKFITDMESIKESALMGVESGTNFIQKKIIGKGYKQIFKDIEIDRFDFLILLFTTFSASTLGAISLFFSGSYINTSLSFGGTALAAGLFIGIILAFLFIDKIEKKFSILGILFIVGPSMNGIGILVDKYSPTPNLPIIVFSINTAIFIFVLILSIVSYINYTTILERGRIIALVMLLDLIYLVGISIMVTKGFLAIIPGIVPLLFGIYLLFNRKKEKTFTHFTLLELEDAEKDNIRESIRNQRKNTHFLQFIFSNNKVIIKYLIVVSAISMLVSLMLPNEFYSELVSRADPEAVLDRNFLIFGIIMLSVGAFAIGLVFDIYGRKPTLSLLLLGIGVLNFISLFQPSQNYDNNQFVLILAVLFSLFLSIALINGELGRSEFYGKLITIFLLSILAGFSVGAVVKDQAISELLVAFPEIEEQFFSNLRDFISSIIFVMTIFALFIMVNIKSTQNPEEQNWPDSLIHLYVIHSSGLLIYEYKFQEKDTFGAADLVSGGLIGLTTMLQEITKETQKLRIIDHGNKKLLFQWDEKDEVVFVLVIERELVIIRHKLSQFVLAFRHRFDKNLDNFKGVNTDLFRGPCDDLVYIFFKRKYLELIPGLSKKLSFEKNKKDLKGNYIYSEDTE